MTAPIRACDGVDAGSGRRLVVVLCALAVAAASITRSAADASEDPLGDYTVTTWGDKEGLPAGRIRAIEQDTEGYLWLGSDAGLFRFDGVRFVPWEVRGPAGPPGGSISALLSASDGSLWVGLGDRGLTHIRNGTLSAHSESEGLDRGFVFSLFEDHRGTVWAGTVHGLYRFRGERWERLDSGHGLNTLPVVGVYEDRSRRLWVATPTTVLRKPSDGGRFQLIEAIETSGDTPQHFSEDSSGTIWITDFQKGFRRAVDGRLAASWLGHRGWGARLLHDRRGNFWVATFGQGLWRVRAHTSPEPPTVEVATTRHGLSSDAIQTLLEDREGNIWVGTRAGLQRLSPRRVTPLTDLPIPRALETTPDGSVWVGTAAGLTRFSASGRQQYGEREGLSGSVVLALHTDQRGTLWVATEHGLARFTNGRLSPLVVARSRQIERIFTITSADDTLWFRDFYQGLFRWRNGKLAPADGVPAPFRRTVQTVYADTGGRLWIGSVEGVLGVIQQDGEFRSYELDVGNIMAIHEDATGALWIGGEVGLSRFSGGRFLTVNGQHGFPGRVRAIADEECCLWLGLSSGIVRLERTEFVKAASETPQQVRYRLLSTADGVAGSPAVLGSRSVVRANDGRLWFVTSAGVTIVDPRTLGPPPPPPRVLIEGVTVDGRDVDDHVSQTRLPPGSSHLQIAFTALTMTDPLRVRFRYRMDGFDRDWIEGGTNRQASYTNLPPRAYRFRVVAAGNDGVWDERGAMWDFAIEPRFHQRAWFYAACGLAVLLLLSASWWFRVRQVRRQFALVLAERARMSRTIHDSLLQGMVVIALQVDDLSHDLTASTVPVRERVVRIRRNIEAYIREARHSIWDLRSPVLETCTFADALRQAGERAVEGSDIQLDVVVSGAPRPCPRETEEQLLHIGQQALHNAVRHARPSRISMELHYEESQLRFRVGDDGCGFDLDAVQRVGGHYGILGMQERAAQVSAKFRIVTGPGRGTEVETVVGIH